MNIVFYTGPQCGLCDYADEELAKVSTDVAFTVSKVNIRTSTELYHLYGARIPVLKREDNSDELGWPFTHQDIEEFLL